MNRSNKELALTLGAAWTMFALGVFFTILVIWTSGGTVVTKDTPNQPENRNMIVDVYVHTQNDCPVCPECMPIPPIPDGEWTTYYTPCQGWYEMGKCMKKCNVWTELGKCETECGQSIQTYGSISRCLGEYKGGWYETETS